MGKYSNAFKLEAIKLSDEIGLKKAAEQLGVPYYTLADWRNNSKHKIPLVEQLNETDTDRQIRELEKALQRQRPRCRSAKIS